MKTEVNISLQSYVIHTEHGASMVNFGNLYDETLSLVEALGKRKSTESDLRQILGDWDLEKDRARLYASLEIVDIRNDILDVARRKNINLGTWFSRKTPTKVRRALEDARKEGTRVRLYSGDPRTGRDWLDEFDTIGTIGRSTGILKVPLLVAEGEIGELAILDHCIVKIESIDDGRILYEHPKYNLPTFEIRTESGEPDGVPYCVYADGNCHSRHRTYADAAGLLAFLSGVVSCPPRMTN